MIINKIGDFGLYIAISILFYSFCTLKYNVIFNICFYYFNDTYYFFFTNYNLFFIIGFFLFIGAMGKSAQIGLHI